MRRIVYTCDRCHNTYEKFKSKSGMLGVQMFAKKPNPNFNNDADNGDDDRRKFLFDYGKKKYLCPSCLEEIESWYFEEKDDEEADFKPSDSENVPFDNADEESLASI